MTPIRHTSVIATLLSLLMALVGMIFFSGCNKKSDGPEPGFDVFQDIVTVSGVTASGCSFTVTQPGTDVLTTYTSSQVLDSKTYPVGTRVLITFVHNTEGASEYTSGPITLSTIAKTYGGEILEGTAAEFRNWATDPIGVLALMRSGKYVNVQALVTLKAAPKEYDLVLDKTTRDQDWPVMYLILESDALGGNVSQYITYASWDIESVWDLPTCEGIKIIYCDANGLTSSVMLPKKSGGIQPTPPPATTN